MEPLFQNAINSIQLGLEDYRANDPKRALSAVRNFYAGTLLLAKEALRRAAPDADIEEILSARYKPVPDGTGGVKYEGSTNTIDFQQIEERFNDFGIPVKTTTLKDLNRIRSDIEHLYSNAPHEKVREAIAKAFPFVADLFRVMDEDPHKVLGDSWQRMLDAREFYERETAICQATYDKVDWKSSSLAEAAKFCPECDSHLIEQIDPDNTEHQNARSKCRACGSEIEAEDLVANALEKHFEMHDHIAAKDGGEAALYTCPECGIEAYVIYDEENGCAWCNESLGDCGACSTDLTPDNVDYDNHGLCSYCGNLMSKDD